MDIDTRRKLIIGALDPRHDNDDQDGVSGHRAPPGDPRARTATPTAAAASS